ncbi:MAG: hypothetical protein ABI168_09875 [Ginsengibacter sp.]
MENNQGHGQQNVPPLMDQAEASKDNERYFNLLVDEIPYRVGYEPFLFNEQVRYYVSINAGPKDIFVWDTSVELFRAIDDKAAVLPVGLEKAISAELQKQDQD